MIRKLFMGLIGVLLATQTASAQLFMDDFNDGNDDGWTRFDPLRPFGAPPADFTFPDGGYRIKAGPSPNPQTLGVSRAASYRADFQYADFAVQVDIVDWNDAFSQGFALIGRTTDVGFGTSDGYLATLQNDDSLVLARFDDEFQVTVLSLAPCPIDPSHDYRLEFLGTGDLFVANVYDLADPGTPISTVMGNDGTYAFGHVGLLSHAFNPMGDSPTDVTFDNFVSVPEPGTTALLAAALSLLVRRRSR